MLNAAVRVALKTLLHVALCLSSFPMLVISPLKKACFLSNSFKAGFLSNQLVRNMKENRAKLNKKEALVRLFEDIHSSQLLLRFSYSPIKATIYRCRPAQVIFETLSQRVAIRLLKITALSTKRKGVMSRSIVNEARKKNDDR